VKDLEAEQIEELRADLVALGAELRRLLESFEEGAQPVDLDEPIGRVSRMDAIQQQSMTQANKQAAQLRLKQVEAALLRFPADEYGSCLECGDGIGFARLKARPEALLCIDCQSAREERG